MFAAEGGIRIKPNDCRRVKKQYDRGVYQRRNQVERFFGHFKRCRRVSTRYGEKAVNFAGIVCSAALVTNLI